MPQPLPFDELLAALKERGLPIGLREHLLVGRLLDRWPGTDLAPLRSALSALLARDPEEVKLVRATFDELYGEAPEPSAPPPPPPEPLPPPRRRWGRVAGIVLATLLVASSLGHDAPKPVEVPPAQGANEPPPDAPEPPTISDEILRPDPKRALMAAGGLATFLFVWLYGGRIRREARSLGRRRWRREAEALPRPYRYQPDLSGLAPPFPAAALDEAAQILGRRAPAPPRPQDLDVDRTLRRTLAAGLAPEIVLRQQSTTPIVLILLDTGGEMRPWRRSVNALLTGLAARGVPLDIWRFQSDAGRVFRTPGGESLSLERLARLRSSSPLLVISTGEGVLAGEEGCSAPWVGQLAAWDHRAWLHPVPDAGYWRPALHEAPVDIWPLTPGGVLAAARQLAGTGTPPRTTAPVFPYRPVTPLNVDRLRWLLTLAPGRDPDLAERLRQRIFPTTSPAALIEALESPPLSTPPPLAPPLEEVHAVLADLLAASAPPPGSAAYERWRLDLALQEVHVPERRDKALQELQNLALGPLAAEVERAADRLPQTLQRPLRQSLRVRAERDGLAVARAEGPPRARWRWPDLVELAATLACVILLFWGLRQLFTRSEPVETAELYTLELRDSGPGAFALVASRRGPAPARAELFQQSQSRSPLAFTGNSAAVKLEPDDRGHWYYVRASLGQDRLAISNRVWVPLEKKEEPPESGSGLTTDLPGNDLTTDLQGDPYDTPLSTEMPPPQVAEPDKRPGFPEPGGEPLEESASRATGFLEITGFPEGISPESLIIEPEYGTGVQWDGKNPVSLIGGTYRLILKDYGYEETVFIRAGKPVSVRIERRSPAQLHEDISSVIDEELAPRISGVYPGVSRNNSVISLTIEGANFAPEAIVEITPNSPPETRGTSMIPGETTLRLQCKIAPEIIECGVDIPQDAPTGSWEVIVINPDGKRATSPFDHSPMRS